MLAACGLDRLGLEREIGLRFDPDVMLPEAGQGALALQVRAGEEELVARADDPETRRRVEAERRCVALVGGGCLAPVAAHHDGASSDRARRGRGRRAGSSAAAGSEPGAPVARASSLAASSPVKESSVHAAPRWARQTELRVVTRSRRSSATRLVPSCPLVAIEPLGDEPVDVDGYDWVVLTSANGARELRRRMRGTPGHVAAIGRATADAFGGADLVARVSTQEGLLAALPRPAGRVLFAGAEGARRLLADALGADVVPLYRTRRARAGRAADRRPRRARLRRRLRARTAAPAPRLPAVSIGPETTAAARGRRRRGASPRPRRTTSTGSSPRWPRSPR